MNGAPFKAHGSICRGAPRVHLPKRNRTLVISLEGVRELQNLNAHSDKTDLERRFDHKQLISPVRTHNAVAPYPPPASTVVPSLAPDLRRSS